MDTDNNLAAKAWQHNAQTSGASSELFGAKDTQGLSAAQNHQGPGFGQLIGEFAGSVGRSQKGAEAVMRRVAQGTDGEVHESMMATEKASISLKFGMTVMKKAIEAYKDMTTRVS